MAKPGNIVDKGDRYYDSRTGWGVTGMKKILVANQGEIALRILEACKEMDIRMVAVFPDADKKHTLCLWNTQTNYFLVGSTPLESCLNVKKIIHITK